MANSGLVSDSEKTLPTVKSPGLLERHHFYLFFNPVNFWKWPTFEKSKDVWRWIVHHQSRPGADVINKFTLKYRNSDWLKIVMWLGTSNQSAWFQNTIEKLHRKMSHPRRLLSLFSFFLSTIFNFCRKIVDVIGNRTQIYREEGEHTDHLTSTAQRTNTKICLWHRLHEPVHPFFKRRPSRRVKNFNNKTDNRSNGPSAFSC